MKKLLLIFGIIILFLSCDKEDEKCNCPKAKMTTFAYGTGYFYINNLPIDCKTGQPDYNWLKERNYIFVKCE